MQNMKSKLKYSVFIILILFNMNVGFFTKFSIDFDHIQKNDTFFALKLSSSTSPLWNYTLEEDFFYETVDISADGMYIATTGVFNGSKTTLSLFQKSSSNPIWNYIMNGYGTSAISSDGNYIVASNSEGKLFLFHRSSNTPRWIYSGGANDYFRHLAISSNGTYIVAGSSNSKVLLINNMSQIPVYIYPTEVSSPSLGTTISVDITPNGTYFVAGDTFGNLYLFNKSSDKAMWNYSIPGSDPPSNMTHVREVSISSNGNKICFGTSFPGKVYYFVKNNSLPVWTYSTNAEVRSISVSSDGNTIVAGTSIFNETYPYSDWRSWVNRNFYYFKSYNSNPLWTYRTNFSINEVALSSQGEYIAIHTRFYYSGTGSNRGRSVVHLFQSNSSEIWQYQLGKPQYGGKEISISEDGKYIIASNKNILYLFDRDVVIAEDSGNGNGDGKGDGNGSDTLPEESNVISFGTSFLFFGIISLISVIIIYRQKLK
jgi:hypothetical protein